MSKQFLYIFKVCMKFNFHLLRNLPAREKKITLPTYLTLLRILLVPCIVAAMVMHAWDAAFWLFMAAAASDVLDGLCARWFNERTFLGACLDPLADKLLTLAVFITLAFVQSPLFAIPRWFVVMVLLKELTLIAAAIIFYMVKGHITIAPTLLGKLAMMAQTLFIIWLFSCYFFHWVPIKTYYAMLAGVITIIFLSFVQYMRIGYQQFESTK